MTFTRASTSRFLLLSLVLAGLLIVPSPVQVRATGFSVAQQVPTSATSFTTWPSAGQDGLGRVWLAYSNKTEGSPKNPGIWFKVWNGSAWAAPKQVQPAAMVSSRAISTTSTSTAARGPQTFRSPKPRTYLSTVLVRHNRIP